MVLDRKEYMRKYMRKYYWRKQGKERPKTRVCVTCGRELPITDFLDSLGRVSRSLECKECRDLHSARREFRREYMQLYMAAYRKKVSIPESEAWNIYNFINEWKEGHFGEVSLQEALDKHYKDYRNERD